MNSARVFESVSNSPLIELVMAEEFCCATPRIIMHRWTASTTTATPLGVSTRSSVSAIWVVSFSCTWRRRENISTSRGIFGASTSYAAILSGRNNIIRDNNDFCLIAGGVDNEIDTQLFEPICTFWELLLVVDADHLVRLNQ